MDHMEEISEGQIPEIHYFLPHHCVLRPDKSTTKLRVVFDASCKTSSNLSLNDIMMKGAKNQDDLFDILLRFRCHKYAILADIKQMFRQIKVAPEDRSLQLIMWRETPKERIRYYQLTTVTYGTKAAPFLATRCLKQLADEEETRYPLTAKVVNDFYMDDIITGANTLKETRDIRDQLIKMLASAKMQLHKWSSNPEALIEEIPLNDREKEKVFDSEESGYIKTLGLSWQPALDNFTFTTTWPDYNDKLTKRKIVSEAAQLFDPLGLVNPVIVTAKIFIQKLWKSKLEWDEELGESLRQEWTTFRQELNELHNLKIGRNVIDINNASKIELHAFSDASEKVYGAVAYIRSIGSDGRIRTKILCSKSRVAPVKVITIPRLELCAAQLATKLVQKVKNALKLTINEIYYWTDSQIVLSWIKGDPATFKTYVAHRIAAIQKSSQIKQWNYINTRLNPADIISRGSFPQELMNSKVWFYGPEFLGIEENRWPNRNISEARLQDEERKTVTLARHDMPQQENVHPIFTIDHRNSLMFLQRSVAFMLRAVKKLKRVDMDERHEDEWLTATELKAALELIVVTIQATYFKEEIQQLKGRDGLSPKNRLSTLSPFIDEQGILRVGGRLENAGISFDAKHPMLLPGTDFLSKLLLEHLHKQHLHVGPTALLAISRQRFWIIGGRSLARATISKCVQCVKCKPQLLTQKMGDLPVKRVLPTRPFLSTGVDFCGPIWTHYHLRGKRPTKSYIAVFCCFSTKAVHMEVVSDLSADGFIGALRRFMARRGYGKDIHCDNATNFVGAKNKLEELTMLLQTKEAQGKIVYDCSTKGVQFHFTPPRAPHFGGLWEAAVKSVKKLLLKTLTSASLTFEELSTVVAEAEAILNSRPLTPLSSSPNDYTALTPGHFLIGEPLTTIPDRSIPDSHISGLSRWKLVTAIRQELWKRWFKEYLSELQQRHKWKTTSQNIRPGMLVLLKEENIEPLKWPMGRIQEVFHGKDGLVRVAIVKTATGIYKRAIHKMAPLSIEVTSLAELQEEPGDFSSKKRDKADDEPPEQSRTKRPRYSSHTLFVILAILMFPLLAFGAPSPFQITRINNNAGIYFEQLGPGQLIGSNWKIIVYYNMSSYWNTYRTIEKGMYKMAQLADLTKDTNYLSIIKEQYDHNLNQLAEGNHLLFGNVSTHRRPKRGLINVVGNIANKLFGVLDDEYAAEIEGAVREVKLRQDKLLHLVQNQTSIIEATTNLMKKSQEEQEKHIKAMQKVLEEVFSKMHEVSEETRRETVTKTFIMLAQYLSVLINEFQEIQRTLINFMTDLHYGRANPLILTSKQLTEHTNQIQQIMPKGIQLPKVDQLYGLITASCKLSRETTLFLLEIPLVSTIEYELLRLIPFPIKINSSFFEISPQTEFLMVNRHRDLIYTLSELEYEKCIVTQPRQRLCKLVRPVYTKNSPKIECEVQLLAQQTISDSCRIQVSKPIKTWIQLYQQNNWLYSMEGETIYNIVCKDEVFQIQLDGNGIISFTESCSLRDDALTIQSYPTITTAAIKIDQPMIKIPAELHTSLSKSEVIEHLNLDSQPFEGAYAKLKQSLQLLKQQEFGISEMTILSKYSPQQHIISYTSVTLLVIIIVIQLIIQIRKRYTMKTSKTLSKEDFVIEVHNLKAGEDVHINA